MFERFTDRARKSVVLGTDEARSLGHPTIRPEHLLLGISREGEGLGALALRQLGVSHAQLLTQVEGQGAAPSAARTGHMPFQADTKKSLENALRESVHLSVHYIGTEHLLLGIIATPNTTANQVLTELGVTGDAVRAQVMRLLDGHPAVSPEPSKTLQPDTDEVETREEWAIRFPDGALSGILYGDGAEDAVRALAGPGEEIVRRLVTIHRQPWETMREAEAN